jgi:DNA-directed RNA polymerase subunit RPC12/RpoP
MTIARWVRKEIRLFSHGLRDEQDYFEWECPVCHTKQETFYSDAWCKECGVKIHLKFFKEATT